MKSRTIALVVTVVVLALVAASVLVPSLIAKRKYDEAKRKSYEWELPGPFTVKEIGSRSLGTLQRRQGRKPDRVLRRH